MSVGVSAFENEPSPADRCSQDPTHTPDRPRSRRTMQTAGRRQQRRSEDFLISSGTRLCVTVPPSPSRPDVFDPHANKRPSQVAASVCAVPPEIETTPVNVVTTVGVVCWCSRRTPKLTARRQAPAIDQSLSGVASGVCVPPALSAPRRMVR